MGEIRFPKAPDARRQFQLREELPHFFPVERGHVLGTPVEEDLLNPPTALPRVGEVE
jgi:hypothetical protein